MKYRRTKSVILLCLIFSSLIMSVYVWFSEELWPNGYNFFIMLKNTQIVREIFHKDIYSVPKENLSKPQKIVLACDEDRSVYYNSEMSFDSIHDTYKEFICHALKDSANVLNRAFVDEAEWYSILRNDEIPEVRSLYVDYSLAYTPALYAAVLGIRNTWLEGEVSAVKEFIVAPAEKDSNSLLYVKDYNDGTIHKYLIDSPMNSEIRSTIEKNTQNSYESYSYSFELNLNNREVGIGEGVVQKVFLDSMVIVSPSETETAIAMSVNPLKGDESFYIGTINAFDMSPGSTRNYTDPMGVRYCIQNYSTLKIHPEGIVEYTADNEDMGIVLSEAPFSLYETLNSAIEFSEKVWHSVAPGEPFSVLVTSDLIEKDKASGEYTFTLDYYFDGEPVSVKLNSKTAGKMNHAVEIGIKKGKIIKYRHLLRKYESTGETKICPSPIDALDIIYKSLPEEEETYIEDIYLSYIEDGTENRRKTLWCAKLRGSDDIIYNDTEVYN